MASNNISSRRQKKIPSKFVDHVMENQSQKKNDKGAQNETKEIRVEKVGLNNGEDENGVGDESGVFGNRDKDHYNGRKSDATDIGTDSLSDLEPEVEILNDNSDDMKDVDNKDNEKVNDTITKTTKNESYVNMVKKDEAPKKLNYKPTEINENGVEVVIFDEMIVKKGSERWNLTVSGYFVGYRMAPNELRYNIRRMWGKYGVRDIRVNNDGTCLFKFNNKEEIGMQKAEHCKLPVWVRMTEVPLEAWSTDGISALANSLGIPLIMDAMTASMCHSGMGRTDFARVLIEMDAIFGHDYAGCSKRIKTHEEVELEKVRRDEQIKKKSVINENGAYKRDKNFGYYQNYVRDKGKSTNEKADSIRNNRNGWTGVVNKRQEYRILPKIKNKKNYRLNKMRKNMNQSRIVGGGVMGIRVSKLRRDERFLDQLDVGVGILLAILIWLRKHVPRYLIDQDWIVGELLQPGEYFQLIDLGIKGFIPKELELPAPYSNHLLIGYMELKWWHSISRYMRNKSSAIPQARKALLEYAGKRKQIGEMVKNHTSDKDSDPECRTLHLIYYPKADRDNEDLRGLLLLIIIDPNSSLGKICLGDNVIEISSDKIEGSGDWNSPEYQYTAGNKGKKVMNALSFYRMETDEISECYIAPCFVNGLEAYDGEVNLEFDENLISNEFAVKLCLDYEVKKEKKLVKKELIVALKGELYFVKFIINPEEDDFEP
ncbi:retrovirus-related pol polyprotein from transposon TNT 1-94 [Tanacetum coccineum]